MLPRGTPQARLGLAVGQIVGGVITTAGGVTGEMLGGAATVTGIGAAVGVPALVVSTGLVVGGVGNIAAGIQGLSQSLMSTEAGSSGPQALPAAGGGGSGGRAAHDQINITPRGLQHAIDRHTIGGAQNVNASTFNQGESLQALVHAAQGQAATAQTNGRFATIVNAGRMVGIDRATGGPTSIYTVITSAVGDLVTIFPGVP